MTPLTSLQWEKEEGKNIGKKHKKFSFFYKIKSEIIVLVIQLSTKKIFGKNAREIRRENIC